jgi:hypothetical protein
MKKFVSLTLKLPSCRRELARFRKLLAERETLSEARDILPLFRECKQLCGLLGDRFLTSGTGNRLAVEYDLFGDFTCDLVVGNVAHREYVFVEFEDAEPDSVFKRSGVKSKRDWSPRFDHGYSQIIDWFGKLHDMEKTDEFEARFGTRPVTYSGLLVVGRDRHFESGELARLQWRRTCVTVNTRQVNCITFDELLEHLTARFEHYQDLTSGGKSRS